MQRACAHLIIKGIVQGVFFRAFTRDVATRLGLGGWVRNLPDGSVEALLEGDKKSVEQAISKCSIGPAGANVFDVDVLWEECQGDLRGFEIRYY